MELKPFIDAVQRELVASAAAGGDDAQRLARQLAVPLESALRLALLGALSAAAQELTEELAPTRVDVRLRGFEPELAVTRQRADQPAPQSAPQPAPQPAPQTPYEADGPTARINFRPPGELKARIEEAASRDGLSVNAWLVRAVGATLGATGPTKDGATGRRYTGWLR
ncbi:toxin-antitoxin system HicB family antitoxin [Fodinicola acaciae]|uniref:toxin-antitoxin system HicB family antitoxin n=1 Tax=Fodinicola acaciae TaxID=2681555 RepID=UPI0013CF6972|nr:toxin-antitoxin system HicB family antitoxin [Fodinicola acaciae]